MAEKSLRIDNEVHELVLGDSFKKGSSVGFHSIRYDFKPASVDTTEDAAVEVGDNHQVTVALPHVQSSGTSHTVYKGNKRPCPKECVLIIDHDTGTYTLERLSSHIQLKKTRIEGSSKIGRPVTPVEQGGKSKPSPGKKPASLSSPKLDSPATFPYSEPDKPEALATPTSPVVTGGVGVMSDSSSDGSSSDSDSSDDEDKTTKQGPPQVLSSDPPPPPPPSQPKFMSTLRNGEKTPNNSPCEWCVEDGFCLSRRHMKDMQTKLYPPAPETLTTFTYYVSFRKSSKTLLMSA